MIFCVFKGPPSHMNSDEILFANTSKPNPNHHHHHQQHSQQKQPHKQSLVDEHDPAMNQSSDRKTAKSSSGSRHCHGGHSCNPCLGHRKDKTANTTGGSGGGDNVSLDAYDLASPCCDPHCVPTRYIYLSHKLLVRIININRSTQIRRRTRHHKDHHHKHKHRDKEQKDQRQRPRSQSHADSPAMHASNVQPHKLPNNDKNVSIL